MHFSDRLKGASLAFFGVVALSPDSLLIRLIDADLWNVMFLRSAFMFSILLLLGLVVNRGGDWRDLVSFDRYAIGIALVMSVGNIFFVASVQNTSVAHTLIIFGAAPVFASLIALWWLKERLELRSWLTIGVVICCLVLVVGDGANSHWRGDLYALVGCMLWSSIFVLGRKTRVRNMIITMSLSGLINALWSWPLSDLAQLSAAQVGLGALLGLCVGLAMIQITLAPRFIPAGEVAVFMPLESVIGSLLVWWFIGEYPGLISIVAGSVMISAIMLNSYQRIRLV